MEADEHKHLTLIAYLSSPCRWHFCFFSFELQSPVAVAQENPIKEILLKTWVRERVLRCSTPASYILPCLRAIISCCVCSRLCLRNSIEKSSDKHSFPPVPVMSHFSFLFSISLLLLVPAGSSMSNADFRKLMMTPKVGPANAGEGSDKGDKKKYVEMNTT